ncbi:putative protease [Terriglobus roseus DSM 18391]|uniref:Putative protease n=2 Tax=Terriglobus roseus TaxID=392734 RepID=I3ZMW7_TERRK|nr:putative protease [Terriglobus roseus DSM 18391]
MTLRALRMVFASGLLLSGVVHATAQVSARRLSAIPAATASRIALPGSVSEERLQASDTLGQLPGETRLQGMALYLKPTAAQDAALTQLIADQQNPASTSYHQWLTPEQYGARFGVSDDDVAVLTAWLQARGFTVDSVAPSRNRIVFSGTSAAVESAFAVTMKQYQRDGRTFFENSTAVQVPAAMADVIGGVTGLSSYRLASPQLRRTALPQASQNQTGLTPYYTTSGGNHYLVPWDFRQIYGMNTLINSGFDGTGITIGVIGQSAVDSAQLTYFQQKTGVSTVKLPTMTLVPNTGVSNKISGDQGESELDLEYTTGSAPGASINFIYTGCGTTTNASPLTNNNSCNNNGVFDALTYAITTKLANNGTAVIPVLTLSYGGCESSFTTYATTGTNPFESYLKQANAQGQTVLVSSGDSGAATCDQSSTKVTVATRGLTVSYPASSPYVTAVGGTTLTSDASTYWSSTNNAFAGSAISYMPETSWNDTVAYKSFAASGGGVSKIFAKPSWQGGTGVPADSHRDVPDVAFPANITEHGYFTCTVDGACTNGTVGFSTGGGGLVGGTSVAAPNFAAMLAVIEQANGGGSLGNVNPMLYTLAQGSSYSTIFHDVTTGDNIVSCTVGTTDCTTGSIGYSAGVGYDLVTGLGSLDASALRSALTTVSTKAPALALIASSTTPTVGNAVTFTLTVSSAGSSTATPTGNVQFTVDGTAVGSAVALSSGVATYSYSGFTATGTHTIVATYAGDSNYNAGTATITVTAVLPLPTITLTPANTTVALNTAVTYTTSVAFTGGVTPTGTVQFQVDGANVGTAVALVSGSATYTYPGAATSGIHTVTAVYSGSATYRSTSVTTNLTVGTVTASISVSAGSSTVTVAAGSAATNVITVTPAGGFTGAVTLTPAVISSTGTFAGCYSAPAATVTSGAVTSTLTITTTTSGCTSAATLRSPSQAKLDTKPMQSGLPGQRTGLIVLSAGLVACFVLRRRLHVGVLIALVVSAGTLGITGCGSGSTTASTTTTTTTTPGTYVIRVTGTSGTLTANTTFTLIVQ